MLVRAGWSVRVNSIGQTVPENWRDLSVANSQRIRKRFADENVDVACNSDQTFLRFYPDKETVIAPKGTKRIGGKIKSDAKAGFTSMVTVNLGTSCMDPPFVVYNGTKLKDARNPTANTSTGIGKAKLATWRSRKSTGLMMTLLLNFLSFYSTFFILE